MLSQNRFLVHIRQASAIADKARVGIHVNGGAMLCVMANVL